MKPSNKGKGWIAIDSSYYEREIVITLIFLINLSINFYQPNIFFIES